MDEINKIESFIERNLKKYPLMTSVDIYKLIYQACFLTGHIVSSDSYRYLLDEYHDSYNLSLHKELYEFIDSDVVRINLSSFDFNLIELFNMVRKSSTVSLNKDFDRLISSYGLKKLDGIPHHSDIYKAKYEPSYRICYLEYLPLYYRVYKLNKFICDREVDKLTIIALEGLPLSGKSMIASKIPDATIIDCTNQDLFKLEHILKNLKIDQEFSYEYRTKNIMEIKRDVCKKVVIVHGRGAYLPFLRDYYDYLGYVVASTQMMQKRLKSEKIDDVILNYYREFDFVKEADILL